ncbi:MAG: phage tail tube protein, partial [Trebonia sp.]
AYSACTWSAAEFTFAADRLVDCTLRGIALASQQETNGSPSYSAVQPFPTWQFTLTIGGTATAVYVTTLTVTIERQNVPIKAINGTQNPAELFAGYQRCTWRFTALADPSDTALNYYLNNTQPSMSIAATTGAGASAQGLTIESHQVAVTRANLTQTGEYLSVEAEGTAIGNTADVGTEAGEGVAVITLENAFPAGTYV